MFFSKKNFLKFAMFSFSFFCAAQEITIPMIRTVYPVKCVTWNKDGTTFAYSEGENVIVRDSTGYNLIQTLANSNGEIDYLLYPQSTAGMGMDQLLSLSDRNIMDFRILPQTEPIQTSKRNTLPKTTALAYNYNGNYIALGTEAGEISVLLQNYLTNSFIERQFAKLDTPIESLYFSRNNKLLVSGSDDDSACIWDVASGKLLNALPYYSKSHVPVLITNDNNYVIMTTAQNVLGIFDMNFRKIREIRTEADIQSIHLSSDGTTVIILTSQNFFYFYDIASARVTGYVPSLNRSKITSYAFNNTTTKLVVCHADNSLYVLEMAQMLYIPGQNLDTFYTQIAEEEEDYEIGDYEEFIPENEEVTEETFEMEHPSDINNSAGDSKNSSGKNANENQGGSSLSDDDISKLAEELSKATEKKSNEEKDKEENQKEEDSKKTKEKKERAETEYDENFLFKISEKQNTIDISFPVGSIYLDSENPYTWGLGFDVTWRNSVFTAPFYFGAGFHAATYWPNVDDYPYQYYSSGSQINPPNYYDMKLLIPGGIQVIIPGNVVHVWAEVYVAGGVSFLWLLNGPRTNFSPSFAVGMRTGVGLKYVGIGLGISYDSILKFVPEIMVSARIVLPK